MIIFPVVALLAFLFGAYLGYGSGYDEGVVKTCVYSKHVVFKSDYDGRWHCSSEIPKEIK